MAIRDCPECDKPISTAATACPQCGCLLRSGKKKRSYLWPLLLIFSGLAVVSVNEERTRAGNARPQTVAAPAVPRCDAKKAGALVQRFMESGVLHKLDRNRSVPRIYVLEAWHGLTIDDKKTLDNVIQCHLTNGAANGPMLAVYHDGRSGKEVATSDEYGFRLN